MESTADRIKHARKEQLAARAASDLKAEQVWTEAIDRLVEVYLKEVKHQNVDS